MISAFLFCIISTLHLYGAFDKQTFTQCISHRGLDLDKKITVEHSLKSFHRVVLESKAKYVEFDVWHTVDHVPLVIHDRTLKRTARSKKNKRCPLTKSIKYLSYLEINKHCELKDGSKIPTMSEVLHFFHQHGVHPFIELKDSPTLSTLWVLKRYLSQSPATVISFKEAYLKRMKALSRSKGFSLKHFDYFPIKEFDQKVMGNFSGIDLSTATNEVIAKWHGLGKKIGVWTINEESQIKDYLIKGVDYITTDQLSKCLQVMKDEEQNSEK
jgi:glycerophosphoryl diester phosphodiesterase